MKITLKSPAGFSDIGSRPCNEDSIFPPFGYATPADRLFMVCDGVGGQSKGEVASALACKTISEKIFQKGERLASEQELREILTETNAAFAKMELTNPETKGMATTLTLLLFSDTDAVVAHLGDSRVYHIRDGKILFKTRDHKWVNELLESGAITEDEAHNHPKRNVITRVISADRNDKPEFVRITDLRPGDYFLMCSDGVLEQLYDDLILYHLGGNGVGNQSTAEIIEAIHEECRNRTRDNFSAYLVQLGSPLPPALKEENTVKRIENPNADSNGQYSEDKSKGSLFFGASFVGLILLALVVWLKNSGEEKKQILPQTKFLTSDSLRQNYSGNDEVQTTPGQSPEKLITRPNKKIDKDKNTIKDNSKAQLPDTALLRKKVREAAENEPGFDSIPQNQEKVTQRPVKALKAIDHP